MGKIINESGEIRDKVVNAVGLITDPVVQTLSPMGRNVLYEDSSGQLNLTNDGVTIARQIQSDDPIEDAVIEVIKHAALKTNSVAGDGTSTTLLLTKSLIRDGMKMVDDGVNPMELASNLETIGDILISRLNPVKVENDEQLYNIAKISSNGDSDIAKDVLDVVKTAGEDGMVFIENHAKEDTIIEKDSGFIIEGGLFSSEYAQNQGFTATFEDCAVLVCDKRIYYEEEAHTILQTAIEAGISKLVIVARDFIGKSVNVFSANHQQNEHIDLLLVKDPNATDTESSSMKDLATYLGGTLITEKTGKLVDNLKDSDFCEAKKVYSNPGRTVVSTKTRTKELEKRIKSLQEEKEKDDTDETISKRLAALTNGMVTVKVGGATAIEAKELVFRYEDSINATRSAMKHGYLPGGGMALLSTFDETQHPNEYVTLVRRFCESGMRQIAKNCGKHEEYVLSQCKPYMGYGYNAQTDAFEDLLESGIIDPYKVTEMAIRNSISVACAILTSGYVIVNSKEKENDQ